MIDIALLEKVLGSMMAAGLSELEFKQGDARVFMRIGAPTGASTRTQTTEPITVTASAIGAFRASHPRRPGTAVKVGDGVMKGAALGYLEIGTTLTGIIAPADGVVTEIVPAEGKLVGHGEHVFTICTEA